VDGIGMIATPISEGFRRFGPLPAAGNGLDAARAVVMASEMMDFERIDELVRRRGRRRDGQISQTMIISAIIDRHSMPHADLTFIDEHFESVFYSIADGKYMSPSDLQKCIDDFKTESRRELGTYRLMQGLSLTTRQNLRPYFRDVVAPAFFERYPNGRIVGIRLNDDFDAAATTLRCLYAAAQSPIQSIKNDLPGVSTMTRWHQMSSIAYSSLFTDFFLYMFYPLVGGFYAGVPGLSFVFLFDECEKHQIPIFPRNWLAIPSSAATFGGQSFEPDRVLFSRGDEYGQRAAHQRFQFGTGYPVDERLSLFQWIVGKVNHLLYDLSDPANFTEQRDPEANIDPIFGYEHAISIDRLIRKTILSMSLDEPGTARMLILEIAEMYDQLSERFGGPSGSQYFKNLFHKEHALALLRPRLALLPTPFSSELITLAERVYAEIETFIIGTIWIKSKVTATGVTIRNSRDTADQVLSYSDFVAALIRAYRNAHHGYFTSGDPGSRRPSRFLYLVDGDLPLEMTLLPILWLLAFLADPNLVGWERLPVQHF
jgi:hypothetical protein